MTEAHFPTGCSRASKTQSCWGRPRRPELLPEYGVCGKFTGPLRRANAKLPKSGLRGTAGFLPVFPSSGSYALLRGVQGVCALFVEFVLQFEADVVGFDGDDDFAN